MTEHEDPLQALVLDTRQVNRQQLADVLRGRAWLDPSAKTVMLDASLRKSGTIALRIEVALMARKALALLLDDDAHPDGLTPRELEELVGAKGSSVRPAIKQLTDAGLICKLADRYVVPAHSFDAVSSNIQENSDHGH